MNDPLLEGLPRRVVKAFTARLMRPVPASGSGGPERIDAEELARRWSVSPRWVADQTRTKNDPIPAMRRGKVVRYLWNDSDPNNALNLWWERHTKGQSPPRQK